MKKLILSLFFLLPLMVFSQIKNQEVLEYAEQMPEFPGGVDSLMKFMSQNIHWPKDLDAEVKPPVIVFVGFIVDAEGHMSDPYLVKQSYDAFNNEAIRVIKLMQTITWKPGLQKGNPVRVKYVLPIRFDSL